MSHILQIRVQHSECRRIEHIISLPSTEQLQGVRLCGLGSLRQRHQHHVLPEHPDQLLRALVRVRRPPPPYAVVEDAVVAHDDDLARVRVDGHAAGAAAHVLERPGGLALAAAGDGQGQDAAGRGQVERGGAALAELDAGDGLRGLEHGALPRAAVVDQVAAHQRHGAVGETDGQLREILERRERGYLSRALAGRAYSMRRARVVTGNCRRPFWMLRLLRHWGVFVFFSILSSAQTFSSGSDDKSSATVTSNAVPSTCFICVTAPDPGSYAAKVRTSLNAEERMWTRPSSVPRNRDSEPEVSDLKLLPCAWIQRLCVWPTLATHIEEGCVR